MKNLQETKKIVTVEKWICESNSWYWIVDENGEGLDGFKTKSQAIDAIKRWGMVRVNKTIKVRK